MDDVDDEAWVWVAFFPFARCHEVCRSPARSPARGLDHHLLCRRRSFKPHRPVSACFKSFALRTRTALSL